MFKQFKILKFDDIYKFQILKFMFLFKNKVLPDLFKEMFSLRSEVHSYNTRNSNSFHTFSCRTNVRKFSIRFQGPLLFNQLDSDIKNAGSISLFKTKLKAFFLKLNLNPYQTFHLYLCFFFACVFVCVHCLFYFKKKTVCKPA